MGKRNQSGAKEGALLPQVFLDRIDIKCLYRVQHRRSESVLLYIAYLLAAVPLQWIGNTACLLLCTKNPAQRAILVTSLEIILQLCIENLSQPFLDVLIQFVVVNNFTKCQIFIAEVYFSYSDLLASVKIFFVCSLKNACSYYFTK